MISRTASAPRPACLPACSSPPRSPLRPHDESTRMPKRPYPVWVELRRNCCNTSGSTYPRSGRTRTRTPSTAIRIADVGRGAFVVFIEDIVVVRHARFRLVRMTDADRADSRDLRFRQARHARIAQHNRQGITEVQRCTLTFVQRNPGVSCDACGRFPGRMRVIREICVNPAIAGLRSVGSPEPAACVARIRELLGAAGQSAFRPVRPPRPVRHPPAR